MRHQEASSTVSLRLEELESWLADVEHWPSFMVGLETAERTGHELYRFRMTDGPKGSDATVWVQHDPSHHVFDWRSVAGPMIAGHIRLRSVGPRRTSVTLALSSYPDSLQAGLAEMLLPLRDRAAVDLLRLDALDLDAPAASA